MDLNENIFKIKKIMGLLSEQESSQYENNLNFCKTTYSESLFQEAINYHKNWILSPQFKEKIKKNNGWDDVTSNQKIKEWVSFLSEIELKYIPTFQEFEALLPQHDLSHIAAQAFVRRQEPKKVYINCFNPKQNQKTLKRGGIKSILIHEIQHCLDNITRANSKESINKSLNNTDTEIDVKVRGNKNIKKLSQQLGISSSQFNKISTNLSNLVNSSGFNDQYACSDKETMARISGMREYYGLTNPSQKIEIKFFKDLFLKIKDLDIKKYLKRKITDFNLSWIESDMLFILLCWAKNGFQDFEIMINQFNDLAKQKNPNQNQNQV
jgi:hypothetical protein